MKLSHLSIENHSRLMHDIDIEVRRHLVLVGPNDSGKSSVMRCLDLLLGAAPEELALRLSPDDLRDKSAPFIVRCRLDDLTPQEAGVFGDALECGGVSIRLLVTQDGHGGVTAARLVWERNARGILGERLLRDAELSALRWRFASSQRRPMYAAPSPEEKVYMQLRRLHGLSMPGDSYLNTAVSSVDLGKDARKIAASYRSVDNALHQSPELRLLREQIAQKLSQISPRTVRPEDVSFAYTGLPENSSNPMEGVDLRVNTGDMHSERSEVMGSIAQFVLAMRGAGILAIDEPELHLHPSSQRSLAKMLAANDTQCIVSTHSADIVSAFDPDCIVAMKNGEARQLEPGALDFDARVRMKLWTHDRLEPLTATKLILVEGITDRLLVQRVAELTGRDLDRLGVSLVQTDGVGKMIPFDRLFGPRGFNVPMFRLIDQDAAEEVAKKLGVPVEQLSSRHVYVSRRDLEEEYVKGLTPGFVWKAMREGGNFSKAEIDAWQRKWGGVQTPSKLQVAEFCRANNNKVPACMSVLDVLTPANAGKIKSINALLDAAVGVAREGDGGDGGDGGSDGVNGGGVHAGVGAATGAAGADASDAGTGAVSGVGFTENARTIEDIPQGGSVRVVTYDGAGSTAEQAPDDIVAAMTRAAVTLSRVPKKAAVANDSEAIEKKADSGSKAGKKAEKKAAKKAEKKEKADKKEKKDKKEKAGKKGGKKQKGGKDEKSGKAAKADKSSEPDKTANDAEMPKPAKAPRPAPIPKAAPVPKPATASQSAKPTPKKPVPAAPKQPAAKKSGAQKPIAKPQKNQPQKNQAQKNQTQKTKVQKKPAPKNPAPRKQTKPASGKSTTA
ncbi:AAA domain-containing protein [Pseudoscardovia radai]|uniref:AAA domain-containing protein n=1 Tax=Pseudoscardovia radai TaxID=987066 RepID=A0A261EUC9_9BIFI|nr:AAA family ATPase [Pseudoscardovia radai]OZG50474.1 AAA domain-containing protein [Pseudoscardovia radai]